MKREELDGVLVDAARLLTAALPRMPLEFTDDAQAWAQRVSSMRADYNRQMLLGQVEGGEHFLLQIGCEQLVIRRSEAGELGRTIARLAESNDASDWPASQVIESTALQAEREVANG